MIAEAIQIAAAIALLVAGVALLRLAAVVVFATPTELAEARDANQRSERVRTLVHVLRSKPEDGR